MINGRWRRIRAVRGPRNLKAKLRAAILLATALLALSLTARAQADYTLQPSPALSSMNLPAGLTDRLQEGSRLVRTANGANEPICDVWWLKEMPTTKTPGASKSSGVLYPRLQTGALVGLLRFLSRDAEDSHDQKLRPGFYTMRYALLAPANADMGDSEYRDFVVLSPMEADSQTTKVLGYDEAASLSLKATGTGHPALVSLVPPNPAYKKMPAVVSDDLGNCALQVKVKDAPGAEFALAILLVTPLKEEGGS